MSDIVLLAESYARDLLQGESTGHDFYHARRVQGTALWIAGDAEVDLDLVQVAALLHDVDDPKVRGVGAPRLPSWLSAHYSEKKDAVLDIVEAVSYSKGLTPSSLEGRIVQDADRLDALGAIGIARCFATGQKLGNVIYDPDAPLDGAPSTSVNHFYEKLFKIKDLMNTRRGRALAEEREEFMRRFLSQFYSEWYS